MRRKVCGGSIADVNSVSAPTRTAALRRQAPQADTGQEQKALTESLARSLDEVASIATETSSSAEEVSASSEEVAAGMEELTASAQDLADLAAVNMSLGGGKYPSFCDGSQGALKTAIDLLRGAGIATAADTSIAPARERELIRLVRQDGTPRWAEISSPIWAVRSRPWAMMGSKASKSPSLKKRVWRPTARLRTW